MTQNSNNDSKAEAEAYVNVAFDNTTGDVVSNFIR